MTVLPAFLPFSVLFRACGENAQGHLAHAPVAYSVYWDPIQAPRDGIDHIEIISGAGGTQAGVISLETTSGAAPLPRVRLGDPGSEPRRSIYLGSRRTF